MMLGREELQKSCAFASILYSIQSRYPVGLSVSAKPRFCRAPPKIPNFMLMPAQSRSFIYSINSKTLKGTEKGNKGAELVRRFLEKRNKWDDRCREGREQIERIDITDHGRLPFDFIAQSRKAGCRLQCPCPLIAETEKASLKSERCSERTLC